MTGKVFCFGELLLRLSPVAAGGWLQQQSMPVYVGGAEANVATALAKWGVPARYASALPDNYLSQDVMAYLEERQIDVSAMLLTGSRIGLYYLQQGTDLKHAGVIYDRAHSSFSQLQPGMIDWDKALSGVSWFHFSAISPALNENVTAVCHEGLEAASKKGITISVDLNHRAKLWQYGKEPAAVMPDLVQYCDVVMGNIWSAASLLGIPVDDHIHDHKSKAAYLDHARRSSEGIQQRFPKCKTVANTFRFDTANGGILYYTSLFTEGKQYNSAEFTCTGIADKVGSGDCFMGGLIYGLYHRHPPQEVIDFAAAAAFGKLQEIGDATGQDKAFIHSLLEKYVG